MIVKLKQGGRVTVMDDVQMLIVEDSYENPVAVAAQAGPGQCFVVSSIDAGEEVFNRTLKGLGLDKTVVRVDLNQALRPPETLPKIAVS